MKLSDLTKDVRTTDIEVLTLGTLSISYCPGKYTPETENRLQSAIETSRPSAGIAEILADVLLDWDLMDDSVDPPVKIPLEKEVLRGLPSAFLVAVSNGITRDMGVSAEERKNSGGGSLQGDS